MKNITTFLILILSFSSFNAHASVWEDTQSWSLDYERQFTEWMQSPNVREGMFTNTTSPYYGINTDCADTAYALRAIFAYEHSLPFAITNPSGDRGGASKTLNNRTNRYDKVGPTNKRLVALVTEIGDSVGTENLTRYDTFPVAIKSVVPGTIFTYKMAAKFGKFIRHTYNIKNINPVGTFDVIYSTQANHQKHGDLIRRKDREFENLPFDPWGFRKFRWPEHLNKDLKYIPQELGPSTEQYTLASSMNANAFFKYVASVLATQTETPAERLTRSFNAACEESQARITYVNEALAYLSTNRNKCLDYEKFDAYSTPARDKALRDIFDKLNAASVDATNTNTGNPQILAFANFIFKGVGSTSAELLSACPINYRPGMTIDLATLWSRVANGRLSSHPNDIVEVRWGELTKPLTKCKRWY